MVIRVIVIEDHPVFQEAIINKLSAQEDIDVVASSARGSDLLPLVRDHSPDVVILDLGMTGDVFEPISAVKDLFQSYPKVRLLILTGYDDKAYVRTLVQAGVSGYLLKSDHLSLKLAEAVRKVYLGEKTFSEPLLKYLFSPDIIDLFQPQEISIMQLMSEGHSNECIGSMLNISEKRVRNVLTQIYAKMDIHEDQGVNARVALINKARSLGLIRSDNLNGTYA